MAGLDQIKFDYLYYSMWSNVLRQQVLTQSFASLLSVKTCLKQDLLSVPWRLVVCTICFDSRLSSKACYLNQDLLSVLWRHAVCTICPDCRLFVKICCLRQDLLSVLLRFVCTTCIKSLLSGKACSLWYVCAILFQRLLNFKELTTVRSSFILWHTFNYIPSSFNTFQSKHFSYLLENSLNFSVKFLLL